MDAAKLDALIEAGLAAHGKDNNWSGHDRGTTVGASEIGGCARRVFYDKHGTPRDPDFVQDWGAAERGHAIEDWYVQRLRRGLSETQGHDVILKYAGDNQKTIVDGAQSATPDGILAATDPVDDVYLEIKSIDPRVYEVMKDAKPQHRLQTQQGMYLVQKLTQHRPQRALIVYINASFVSQRRYYTEVYDASIASALSVRAGDILYGKYTHDNPPRAEGKMEGGKECEYCPFYRTCTAHDVGCLPKDVRPLFDFKAEDVEKVRELCAVQRDMRFREDELVSGRKHIETEIVDMLKRMDTKKLAADWGSVSVYPQAGPPSFDYKQMEADGVDIEKYRRPANVSPRINVSLKK